MTEELERLRRKENQAWELAGCARADGDRADEHRWTEKALEYGSAIAALLRAEEKNTVTKEE